jgi:surface polysaccharide O-acyltransferase-like enzyme
MKRNAGLDLLKLMACFAVVVLHVTGLMLEKNRGYDISDMAYYAAGFAIPIFFMVNGYLLLNRKEMDFKYISKKIINFLVVVFLWNLIISLMRLLLNSEFTNPVYETIKNLFQRGYFWQFWFFGALIIIYILLPFIHKYFKVTKIAVVLTIVFVATSILIDFASSIRSYYGMPIIQIEINQTLRLWTWLAYYMLGGLIGKSDILGLITKHISATANVIIMILMTIITNVYQYMIGKNLFKIPYAEYFYDNIFTFLWVFSLFILVIRINQFEGKLGKIAAAISSNSMGIYIIHVTVIKMMDQSNIFNTPVLNIGLIIIVFFISLVFSAIICKLPIVSKLVKI